ncbi:MAG TPA: excinuclease ABC subunit UvrA [Gemmatimonadales bacterium]|nr:excinuclease ABC subunit UvrA [Gemmatimonadales bacterium]
MSAPPDRVILRNARQHNLKGITVELPRRALTVITGPSGSGKSSLAFDTLYAEGQRRYIESLSTYAKQFLERMPKPLVDSLEGLSPAVAIEQKNPTTSSRSTVGTATEIYDFLRLLWARVGTPYCLHCGSVVKVDTVEEVVDDILGATGTLQSAAGEQSEAVLVTFPLPDSAHRPDVDAAAQLVAAGFVRAQVDGVLLRLDEPEAESRVRGGRDVLVIVDRLAPSDRNRGRLADAVATAFAEGEGVAVALDNGRRRRLSSHPTCSACGRAGPALTPALFSFNNPRGACPGCNGFGAVLEYDESLIVPESGMTLAQGAIDPWTKPRYEGRRRLLRETARARGIPANTPWRDLDARQRHFLLHGGTGGGRYVGVFPFLERLESKRYKQYIRVFLRQYQLAKTCPACSGARLKPEALAVQVGRRTIAEVAALTAAELQRWIGELTLTPFQQAVARHLLEELTARVSFVVDVGLGYLTIDRQTRTLSGGEAQRIALSNALGSKLTETLYVLDEPTIGLHPSDVQRLLALLRRLATAGNTVVVVEHDPAAMAVADYMVELGPGSGTAGGSLVYQGPAAGVKSAGTLTGQYLSGEKRISVPSARRPALRWLTLRGARLHNLENVDVRIPLHALVAVTGVSGSGKSTLVHDVLYRQLERRLRGGHSAKEHLGEPVGEVAALEGWEAIGDVVLIDQSPIGRTPRSNPVTYVKAFDELRQLFAALPRARERRYTASTFSFNVRGGRCEACEGAGAVLVEMVFLANVFVPCEMCGGRRFKKEVLDVRLDGQSIHDVLEWTVDEALRRFHKQPRLARALWQLQQVGLGYLRLGQPATTLSGGEAQRLKIARELTLSGIRPARGGGTGGRRNLYILDEPTTGLHLDDVRTLCRVLDRLVDAGHTVVVIEHHLDVIKRADWVIDLGPGAGTAGGRIVAAGTPEAVGQAAESATGRYLKEVL